MEVFENHKTQSLLVDLIPTLLGVAVSGKLNPFIIPTLIKLVILPLLDIVNTISKALIAIGLISHIISTAIPILLEYFGFLQLII